MFLTNNMANMLKNIFLTDLLAIKKNCHNLIDKFNYIEKCEIDKNYKQMNFDKDQINLIKKKPLIVFKII